MRILIIEDEQEIIEFLKKSFESECFIVDTAMDGAEGSYLARTNKYDLIILDNLMPKKNGLEVCKEIRGEEITTPIIMLSVQSESSTKVDLLKAGADDYLTKPFSFEELLARTRALLRRPTKTEYSILEIGDLKLDTPRHLAIRGKKEIYLTRKEFMLLEYLMQNRGAVMSRGMIMEHVWDMNADPFSNTIESHIVSLRKKIDAENKPKIIHTVPGRGYKADLLKNFKPQRKSS